MISLPQAQRDLRDVEAQLRFARQRLDFYELVEEPGLASHTRAVVAGLEGTKEVLVTRIQSVIPHVSKEV